MIVSRHETTCRKCFRSFFTRGTTGICGNCRWRLSRGYKIKKAPRLARLPYAVYLRTPHWLRTRGEALERAGRRCDNCGGNDSLEVHHLTYKRVGRERWADLRVLCHDCHRATHGIAA